MSQSTDAKMYNTEYFGIVPSPRARLAQWESTGAITQKLR